jgi:leader peptidase (prepilin peptidase)/N-methyltransferase
MRFLGIILIGWIIAITSIICVMLPVTRRFSQALCHSCHQPISFPHYFFYEILFSLFTTPEYQVMVSHIFIIIIALIIYVFSLSRMGFWIGLLVMAYFTLVSVIDIEHRIIMHPVSIVGAIIGFLVGVWQHGWKATLLGGIFGLGLMLIIFYGGSLFVKWISKIKKNETNEEAFGFGDVVLSGVLGLFLGWPGIVGGVILAILLGGIGSLIVISISFITKKYHAFMAIPYGPFLLLGAAILLFQPGL